MFYWKLTSFNFIIYNIDESVFGKKKLKMLKKQIVSLIIKMKIEVSALVY